MLDISYISVSDILLSVYLALFVYKIQKIPWNTWSIMYMISHVCLYGGEILSEYKRFIS